jgi:hypothetical protein
MKVAEHRAKRVGAGFGLGDAFLVEVVAEDVDAVGAGQVVEHVAVDVGDGDAGRGFHEGAGAEIFLHQPAVLERDTVGLGELQVGDAFGCLGRQRPALGKAFAIELAEAEEGVLALGGDGRRRSVGAEEIVDVELVVREQSRYPLRHLGVAGQRSMLGARQRQTGRQFGEYRGGSAGGGGQGENQSG